MSENREGRLTFLGYGLMLIGITGGLVGLYLTSENNYLLFHTLVELASVVVAGSVFVVFWNTRRFVTNKYFLFIAVAWLFVAVLDLVHAFAYEGMTIISDETPNTATQLWIAARYLQAVSLLVSPLF